MNNNLIEYKKFLTNRNIIPKEEKYDEGIMLMTEEYIKNGESVTMRRYFQSNDTFVDISLGHYIRIIDSAKMDNELQIINELNKNYSFCKFYVDYENYIVLAITLLFEDNFDPELVMDAVVEILKISNNVLEVFATSNNVMEKDFWNQWQ